MLVKFAVFLIAAVSSVAAAGPGSHRARRNRPGARLAVRGQPADIAPGAATEAEGCTQYYHVKKGEYCYIVAKRFGLTLQEFYDMNPILNQECDNLWAYASYCVSKKSSVSPTVDASASEVGAGVTTTTTLTSAPQTTTTADSDKNEQTTTTTTTADATTTTAAPTTTTTTRTTTTTTRTTTTTQAATTTSKPFNPDSGRGVLAAAGISRFLGDNVGIGSWFRANSGQDNTNGRSWCEIPYYDNNPGFAPAVQTMRANFNWNNAAAARAYCGLEATFESPDGNSATFYIMDGFAQEWVLTPGSVDILIGAFPQVYGSYTTNKNDVVKGLKWRLTGRRNGSYTYRNEDIAN